MDTLSCSTAATWTLAVAFLLIGALVGAFVAGPVWRGFHRRLDHHRNGGDIGAQLDAMIDGAREWYPGAERGLFHRRAELIEVDD